MQTKEKKEHSEPLSLADLAKKIVYTSLGSAAMAREVVKDSKKQKEVLSGLLNRAEKTKDELVEILAREMIKFLGKINVADEISKAFKGLVINLNASIDFREKKGAHAVINHAKVEKHED